MQGYLAYSLAGHDKDRIYLIIKEDADYVWLVDGEFRTLDNPKKKNKKHIQIIKKYGQETDLEVITNEKIKYVIKRLSGKDIKQVTDRQ